LSDPTIFIPAKNEARLIPNLLNSPTSSRVLVADANSIAGTLLRMTYLPRRKSGDSCAS